MSPETRDGLKVLGRITWVLFVSVITRPGTAFYLLRLVWRMKRGVATEDDYARCLGL